MPTTFTASGFSIRSSAFEPGKPIPRLYTGEGSDVSPALSWTGAPAGTKELALICDDPDAPKRPEPWVHWVIYNIPAAATGLPEGIERTASPPQVPGARQGQNTWTSDNLGYRGPMPPPGHGVHHYHFRLYALGAALNLKAGADKKGLIDAMKGHVLAETEVIGTYERK